MAVVGRGERALAQTNGAPLATRQVDLNAASEVALEIEARAPGASWARPGAEAAALVVSVDGKYNQDLMLWAGDRPHTYRVTLGQLSPGAHQISVGLNPARSARAARAASRFTGSPATTTMTMPMPAWGRQ